MSAALDRLDAQLADMRRTLEAPGFRCRTDAERKANFRRDMLEAFTGETIPEPPPCDESKAALADLLDELRRLERDAADLRK